MRNELMRLNAKFYIVCILGSERERKEHKFI